MHLLRRKRSALPPVLLLWLLAGIVVACGPLSSDKNDEQALLAAADRFNRDLRWEDYKAAATRTAPSKRDNFWDQVDRMQGQVRIMDHQVVDVAMNREEGSGTVTLRYRFFLKRRPQLQTAMVHQKWVFSEKEHVWQVMGNDLEKLIP